MDENIEDLFIVKDGFGKQNAQTQAKRALPFGRITQEGAVVIDHRTLTKADQLKLCLVIRHIASSLAENITKEVRAVELTDVLGQRHEAIGAALSRLASEGFAKKEGHGRYSVFPYKIDAFLDYLESDSTRSSSGPRKTTRKAPGKTAKKVARKSKGNSLTGIGKHIQQLIDDDFFKSPRFISEVVEELKKENVFRDSRVIDKTVRDSFVSMRRTLQRVKNADGGKAKWKYVIRK